VFSTIPGILQIVHSERSSIVIIFFGKRGNDSRMHTGEIIKYPWNGEVFSIPISSKRTMERKIKSKNFAPGITDPLIEHLQEQINKHQEDAAKTDSYAPESKGKCDFYEAPLMFDSCISWDFVRELHKLDEQNTIKRFYYITNETVNQDHFRLMEDKLKYFDEWGTISMM